MIDVVSSEQAWLAHYMHNIIQYGGILTIVLAAWQFHREWRKDKRERRQEHQDVAVWRGRMEERVKCLEGRKE